MKILLLIFMITLVWVIATGPAKADYRVPQCKDKVYLTKAGLCTIIAERRDPLLVMRLIISRIWKVNQWLVFESHDARSVISRGGVWCSPDPYPSGFT